MLFMFKRLSNLITLLHLLAKWSATITSIVPQKKSQDRSLPQSGPDFQFSAWITTHSFFHHTLTLNSPECIDFACFTAALWSSSFGSLRFPCPWVLLFATFTCFPLNKPSIVLWITTHLLSVYRNKQLLSKMNSQRSEDSAETLLLSEWKLATHFMLHASPTGITWVIGKCCQFQKAQKLFFLYGCEAHNFLFFKHLFLNKSLHSLKALSLGKTNRESMHLQSGPRSTD